MQVAPFLRGQVHELLQDVWGGDVIAEEWVRKAALFADDLQHLLERAAVPWPLVLSKKGSVST